MDNKMRERIVELVRRMRENTVDKGCTPGEAAKFAAKVSEYIERYQISEAELRSTKDGAAEMEFEICQNYLRTHKKVFNPGMTAVVNALSQAMCCKCVLLHLRGEAVYGVVGDSLDADYVCQISISVVPALEIMANMEGREHGHEKASLVRWRNQYLEGAAQEIRRRIEKERADRAAVKELEHHLTTNGSTALVPITGLTIATAKREKVEASFKEIYPRTRQTFSRSGYDSTARERGREAGRRVGLNIQIGEK